MLWIGFQPDHCRFAGKTSVTRWLCVEKSVPENGSLSTLQRQGPVLRVSGDSMTQLEAASCSSRAAVATMAKEEPLPGSVRTSLWKDRARLLGVLAHPVRLAILEILFV